MARVLLDTSAYSALLRGHAGAKRAVQEAEEIFVNAVILGELLAGFARGKRRAMNERELRSFLDSPRVGVLPLDADSAERYAAILAALWRAGKPIPTNDLWIAATAMQHGLRILTADAHFRNIVHVLVDLLETP